MHMVVMYVKRKKSQKEPMRPEANDVSVATQVMSNSVTKGPTCILLETSHPIDRQKENYNLNKKNREIGLGKEG